MPGPSTPNRGGARKGAHASSGEFSIRTHGEPNEIVVGRHANETPIEVDLQLEALFIEREKSAAPLAQHSDAVFKHNQETKYREENPGRQRNRWDVLTDSSLEYHTEKIAKLQALVDDVDERIKPLDDEFDARGGWTRAFRVLNGNGHVHRSRSCSTCYPTTRFGWLPSVSGMDEDEIVDLAADMACTRCYPSAPVIDLSNPRECKLEPDEMRIERERKEAERAERDRKKAEKEAKAKAKAIVTATGEPIYDDWNRPFNNEVTAQSAAISAVESLVYFGFGENPQYEAGKVRLVTEVLDGIAAKRETTTDAVILEWKKKVYQKVKSGRTMDTVDFAFDKLAPRMDQYRAERARLQKLADDTTDQDAREAALHVLNLHIGAARPPRGW
ncbi:hypothetical protein [Leifsonia sp. Leaf264]|uniref:hypothetical protein n=1 Tax=Leifsonia sp. Leaf264 TaxID=1736314 RepID=UPI000700DB0A|nr:hypothetical protein [Leifsonia sp. Leaf264]KQO98148.1 hypothetical protein ASF30_08800 [Leifsonia sp. Leaf264]